MFYIFANLTQLKRELCWTRLVSSSLDYTIQDVNKLSAKEFLLNSQTSRRSMIYRFCPVVAHPPSAQVLYRYSYRQTITSLLNKQCVLDMRQTVSIARNIYRVYIRRTYKVSNLQSLLPVIDLLLDQTTWYCTTYGILLLQFETVLFCRFHSLTATAAEPHVLDCGHIDTYPPQIIIGL